MLDTLLTHIARQRETVIDLQRRLTAIPALGPDNKGEGEQAKADFLIEYLKNMGLTDIRSYDAPDPRVPSGLRPNVAAVVPGKNQRRTFWIISHTDIVPPGDLSLWNSDPYELVVDGDMVIGRGVEDNQQSLVSSVLLAKALIDNAVTPPMNLGLILVADEETGSKYGLEYVVNHHPEAFSANDLFLVPDFGNFTSEMVEVAEKSMFWLKVTVLGKQCHASTPSEGINTLTACADLILKTRGLHLRFDARNELFSPPHSTFEATKKEANVENVNTIPGKDVFYLDCRVLPQYDLDEVLEAVKELGREVEKEHGVTIRYEFVQREQAAPPTSPDSEIVSRLIPAIKAVYDNNPQPMGIGGGTVAAMLRRKGYPAAVWCTCIHNAHQPNERSSVGKTLGDAQVMARVLME